MWGAASVVLFAAYMWCHQALFGLRPIVSYMTEPSWSVSIWALIWTLGCNPDPGALRLVSGALVAGFPYHAFTKYYGMSAPPAAAVLENGSTNAFRSTSENSRPGLISRPAKCRPMLSVCIVPMPLGRGLRRFELPLLWKRRL